jgi:hypothetical protein
LLKARKKEQFTFFFSSIEVYLPLCKEKVSFFSASLFSLERM